MAFNRESFEHFWQHLNVLFEKKADKVAANDFIVFKDRSTGILYYGGMDNGNWVTGCDVDHIEVVPVTPSKIYTEGMRVSPEDFIVTVVFVDGTSKVIENYQFDNSKITLESQPRKEHGTWQTNMVLII